MEVSAAKEAPPPPHIPIEIIRCILLKLKKMKALIRCKCVCKEWRSTIEDPDFKLSYRGRRQVLVAAASVSGFDFTSITTHTLRIKTLFQRRVSVSCWWSGVWCSCNGLVLFSAGKHILLWNPSTRCCTKVLELRHLMHRHNVVSASGLCYVPSTGDYKAVLLLRPKDETVLVASLKNKEWREVVLFPHHTVSVGDGGVNFHNTLHWRVAYSPRDRDRDWDNLCPPSPKLCNKVVYFESESDEFKELELPTPTFPEESCAIAILGLGIIDGCLSMARERRKETGEVEVLVRKEYGVKKSWVSQFVISTSQFRSGYLRDFTFYSSKYNTEPLMICSHLYGGWGTLVENCFGESGRRCAATICSYVESFVSPMEFIWRDDDQRKRSEYDAVLSFILKWFNNGRRKF